MNSNHWILAGGWLLFCFLHSFLASGSVKAFCKGRMGNLYPYFRFLYSLVAVFTLVGVLVLQFSIHSYPLGSLGILKYLAGLPLGIAGLVLMAVSIRKYFFNLSGIDVFFRKEQRGGASREDSSAGELRLETSGLHHYVRHPLYLGTLLLTWSLFLFFPLMSNLLACIMITAYTLVGIRFEEQKLLQEYGEQYASYRRKVPMLIPRFKHR